MGVIAVFPTNKFLHGYVPHGHVPYGEASYGKIPDGEGR
jgi:hypothetical protein